MTHEIAIAETQAVGAFTGIKAFEDAQRMASALAASDLVPKSYQGNVANCIMALEVAQRCAASPLMVMQNLDIIHGKTSWSAKYIIAAINSCGRFEPLRYRMEGSGDSLTCVAFTKNRAGDLLEGPKVSIEMAKKEGWFQKAGSKWATMPELMIQYRSASFFGRLHASDVLLGMRSSDEEREILEVKSDISDAPETSVVAELNKKMKAAKTAAPKPAVVPEVMPAEAVPHVSSEVDGEVHF